MASKKSKRGANKPPEPEKKPDVEQGPTDPKLETVRVIIATNVRMAGRPSTYTEAIADEICERLGNGESLLRICNDPHIPSRWSVFRWLDEHADFATKYARAREIQADFMNDLINETARLANAINAPAVRVQVDAYKWTAEKLKPRAYGNKIQHADADGGHLPVPYFQIHAGPTK